MPPGRILVAEREGAYVIKLTGDVRVTVCAAFDDFVEKMLSDSRFNTVVIDLSQAEGIDSTTLGLLAKISILARDRFAYRPLILSTNPSITRLIESMGFAAVFDVRTDKIVDDDGLRSLGSVVCDERDLHDRVIEAHRVLMGLSEENRARFEELVTTLEQARS